MGIATTTRRRMMWYSILLWLSLIASCTTHPAATSTATPEPIPATAITETVARLTATSSEITVGKTVVVDVIIEDVNALYRMDLQLKFNPLQLEVVDADAKIAGIQVAHGDFLDVTSSHIHNNVGNNRGTIKYDLAQVAPTKPVSGAGTLITFVLRGKDAGILDITITELLLSNSAGGKIPVTILQQK